MAKAYPNKLPNWVILDPRRSAEVKVYNKLLTSLDDEWLIFYSRPWWGTNKTGGEKDGEADFILAHPKYGLLFIEVKGGEISYNPKLETWTTKDRNGIVHTIKNPVQQAVTCKHQILQKLISFKDWPRHHVIAHHGVVLVDTVSPNVRHIAGYESELFCHANEFDLYFEKWINKRLTSHVGSNEHGPGAAGINCLIELLADPINIRCTMSRDFDSENKLMNNTLTGMQFQILGEIMELERLVVEGGAGTGKTLIACEAAIRLTSPTKKVLLACSSNSLTMDLRRRTNSFNETLTIKTVEESLGDNQLYDCIIIDEAQDVDWSFWDKIISKLRESNSKLIVFMDSNQAIYRLAKDLESRLKANKFVLRINLRNTKKIAEVTSHFYEGPFQESIGPKGVNPKLTIEFNQDKVIDLIISEIKILVTNESIPVSDIAVLSSEKEFIRRFTKQLTNNRLSYTSAIERNPGGLVVDSIINFKGLEASVIFLQMNSESINNRELTYVGSSRARNYLHMYTSNKNEYLSNIIAQLGG